MHGSARSIRFTALAGLGALALAVPTAYAAPVSESGRSSAEIDRTGAQGTKTSPTKPKGPNPYLSFLPDPSKADHEGWRRYLEARAETRQARREQAGARLAGQPILVDEGEPDELRGSNDSPAYAQFFEGFGTGEGNDHRARILGHLAVGEEGRGDWYRPNSEDDGSISLAEDTDLTTAFPVWTEGTIGDGPHGSAGSGSGDFDFYAVEGTAGSRFTAEVWHGTLADSYVVLWDAEGNHLDSAYGTGSTLGSGLEYDLTEDGTYYVSVSSGGTPPTDPFDSAGGSGVTSEGTYDVGFSIARPDVDVFSFHLRPGDVVSASVEGSAERVALYDPAGREVKGSSQDLTALFAPHSPLPGGGNAVTDHVASVEGEYSVGVSEGSGDYDITLEVYRPTIESDEEPQVLFLDFDGERVNTGIFDGPGIRDLSPLRAFLPRWGLARGDEEAVAREVIETVEENLGQDLAERSAAGAPRLEIGNSYDHPDTFGDPNVSRVVIGGSVAEAGINTIGIAQHIDPGNFGHEDTALVLLDNLSGPEADPTSLNHYLGEDSDRTAFLGQAIGNIVAHEAGHFLGNFHTESFNEHDNLMDTGGDRQAVFGVGPDGIGGTEDDFDLDFGEDTHAPTEGYTGIEDTLNRTAFGVGLPLP